jgi:hypothetical protein
MGLHLASLLVHRTFARLKSWRGELAGVETSAEVSYGTESAFTDTTTTTKTFSDGAVLTSQVPPQSQLLFKVLGTANESEVSYTALAEVVFEGGLSAFACLTFHFNGY